MAGTNIFTQPQLFSDPSWTLTNTVVEAGATDPTGGSLAFELLETATTGVHSISQQVAVSLGSMFSTSIWVCAFNRSFARISLTDNAGLDLYVDINLSTGANVWTSVGGYTDANYFVEYTGNGWFRTFIRGRSLSTSIGLTVNICSALGTISYAGSANTGIYIFDAWLLNATTCYELPIPFPANTSSFTLAKIQLQTPVGAGFIQTIERGPNMWVAAFETPPLSPLADQLFEQLLDLLDGGNNTFLGFDPRKTKPYASIGAPYGSEPWTVVDGTSVLSPLTPYLEALNNNTGVSTVTLYNLAPGYVMTQGDMISYLDANIWRCHRALQTETVNGEGQVTLKVTPAVTPVGITQVRPRVRLTRACTEMKLVGLPAKADKVGDPGPSYKFSAAQFINLM